MTTLSDHVPRRPTVALDFDGVLHAYSKGWHDGTIYDGPVPGAVEAVRALNLNYDLVIFTCREDRVAVHEWAKEHLGLVIRVVNEKPLAALYIDDRGLRFEGDWPGTLAAVETLTAEAGHGAPLEACSYCGEFFPKPIELHHAEADCGAAA